MKMTDKICCVYSHGCKKDENKLRICCNFCREKNCSIRCKDPIDNCCFSIEPSFHSKIETEEYEKYITKYNTLKKGSPESSNADSIKDIKRGRGRPKTNIKLDDIPKKIEISTKRGRGRPPKNQDIKQSDTTQIKRGRGRPRKIKN